MKDRFGDEADVVWGQARRWGAITPHDTNQLAELPKAIRCNVAGTVNIVGEDGNAEDFVVAAGETLPCRPVIVKSTGTTATGIKALY